MPASQPHRVPAVVGGLAAALTGVAVGGPYEALVAAAATPSMIDLAGRAWTELQGARQGSAATLLVLSAEDLNADPEELVGAALKDPAMSQLLFEAMRAAADAYTQEKIRALARAVANGLRDDGAKVEPNLLTVRALADLEPVHVRVLIMALDDLISPWAPPEPFTTHEIEPLLGVLNRQGLVTEGQAKKPLPVEAGDGMYTFAPAYGTSHFGRHCLRLLGETAPVIDEYPPSFSAALAFGDGR